MPQGTDKVVSWPAGNRIEGSQTCPVAVRGAVSFRLTSIDNSAIHTSYVINMTLLAVTLGCGRMMAPGWKLCARERPVAVAIDRAKRIAIAMRLVFSRLNLFFADEVQASSHRSPNATSGAGIRSRARLLRALPPVIASTCREKAGRAGWRAGLLSPASSVGHLGQVVQGRTPENRTENAQTPTAKAGMCHRINELVKKMVLPKAGMCFRINKSPKPPADEIRNVVEHKFVDLTVGPGLAPAGRSKGRAYTRRTVGPGLAPASRPNGRPYTRRTVGPRLAPAGPTQGGA